ncbi:unnamed protein product, partial [Effrenium voratum]
LDKKTQQCEQLVKENKELGAQKAWLSELQARHQEELEALQQDVDRLNRGLSKERGLRLEAERLLEAQGEKRDEKVQLLQEELRNLSDGLEAKEEEMLDIQFSMVELQNRCLDQGALVEENADAFQKASEELAEKEEALEMSIQKQQEMMSQMNIASAKLQGQVRQLTGELELSKAGASQGPAKFSGELLAMAMALRAAYFRPGRAAVENRAAVLGKRNWPFEDYQVSVEGGGCFSKRFIYEDFPACLQDLVTPERWQSFVISANEALTKMSPWERAGNYMVIACIFAMLMGILIGIVLSFDMVAMAIAMGSGAALALLGFFVLQCFVRNMERMHMDTVHMLCAEVSQESDNLIMQWRKAQRGDCCYELNMRIYVPSELEEEKEALRAELQQVRSQAAVDLQHAQERMRRQEVEAEEQRTLVQRDLQALMRQAAEEPAQEPAPGLALSRLGSAESAGLEGPGAFPAPGEVPRMVPSVLIAVEVDLGNAESCATLSISPWQTSSDYRAVVQDFLRSHRLNPAFEQAVVQYLQDLERHATTLPLTTKASMADIYSRYGSNCS